MNSETGRLISNEEYEKMADVAKQVFVKVPGDSLTDKQLFNKRVSIYDNRSLAGKLRIKHKNSKRNLPCPCGSGKKFKKCCWYKVA